jgi:polyisoprenoid-binding protein YceI
LLLTYSTLYLSWTLHCSIAFCLIKNPAIGWVFLCYHFHITVQATFALEAAIKKLLFALALVCHQLGYAELQMDPTISRLNFTSIKNGLFAELHHFTTLSGSVSDDGELLVEVVLGSVDTRVDVRDTRMRETLFETEKFPLAKYRAKIDTSVFDDMSDGEVQLQQIKGKLELHGKEGNLDFLVRIIKSNSGALLVSTVEPAFINAEQYDLGVGILKLRQMAGLSSIARTIPVTFSTVFRQADENEKPAEESPVRKLLPF